MQTVNSRSRHLAPTSSVTSMCCVSKSRRSSRRLSQPSELLHLYRVRVRHLCHQRHQVLPTRASRFLRRRRCRQLALATCYRQVSVAASLACSLVQTAHSLVVALIRVKDQCLAHASTRTVHRSIRSVCLASVASAGARVQTCRSGRRTPTTCACRAKTTTTWALAFAVRSFTSPAVVEVAAAVALAATSHLDPTTRSSEQLLVGR